MTADDLDSLIGTLPKIKTTVVDDLDTFLGTLPKINSLPPAPSPKSNHLTPTSISGKVDINSLPPITRQSSSTTVPQKVDAPQPPAPTTISPANNFPSMLSAKVSPALSVTKTTVGNSMDKLSPLLQTPKETGNHVFVSIADKKTIVYGPTGNILGEYPVYIGKPDAPTPRGEFRIMENSKPGPSEWYYDGHWLGFALGYNPKEPQGYAGFHGWVYDHNDDDEEKETPGWKTSTHGCIQMRHPDLAEFSRLVGVGDPVTIIDRPLNPPAPKAPLPKGLQ